MSGRRKAVLGVVWTTQVVMLVAGALLLAGLVALALLTWLERSA